MALAALLGLACAETKPKPVDFAEIARDYRAKDYPRVRDMWTRHAKLVTDDGTVLEGWATLKTWDFRQAYVECYADAYGMAGGERMELQQAQLEASRRAYEFHIPVQSTAYKWNDLEKKTSPWRITLVDGTGVELSPDSVEVPKLPELYESQFFPARTPFTRTYVIRFDRKKPQGEGPHFTGPDSGRIILRVASPMGRVDFVWQSS